MTKKIATSGKKFNILFTCIGRRVSLLKSFKSAAGRMGLTTEIIGTERTQLSPALQLCDYKYIVNGVKHAGYVTQLLEIVKKKKVKLLVPTVDLDLKVLAKNKQKFKELGCLVLVSDPKVIDVCQDKRKTYRFMIQNGFDTPVTITAGKALEEQKFNGPYFIKPWDGYASRGAAKVKSRDELVFYANTIPNPICQELIIGTEYTCDVYVGFDMKAKCVVPRKRIEVRAGEVSKAKIEKNKRIMSKAAELVEALGAGPGVITIQLFLSKGGRIEFIEINPRFGGGVPLSIKAGANFPKWILQELTGIEPRVKFDSYKNGLTMLRYDSEVWIDY